MDAAETPPPLPKRCLGCGYILDGLPEPRCPECGREFDPDDPNSYRVRYRSGRSHLVVAVGGLAVLAASLVALIFSEYVLQVTSGYVLAIPCVLIPLGLVMELAVLDPAIRVLRGPTQIVWHRGSWVAALIISALVLVTSITILGLALLREVLS